MSDARDKGAHYFRCDFQVHTPRDAKWIGNGAATPADRKTYADELIQACRSKGLDAVAITDHHDFAFFSHVKAAAEREVDAYGNPIPKDQQIVIFPGVELTLSSPPCQTLLLLDAEFDEGKLNDILTTLSIDVTAESTDKLPSVDSVSPTSVTSLNDLEEKLSLQKWLKGRFIILPHVADKGYKTIFREGFEKHYKEMRCVGGYVEGDYKTKAGSKASILEGRQQNNGYQGLGVFQTSDNRKRDHSDLGKHITWVKWSEPTAEALRQACLARESRLSHEEPQLPALWIASMSVSHSKFLSRIDIDFSQQYNTVIGGRGTGKSTILEYLRWGLCDQPVESADSELAPVQIKRKKLIDDTLQRFDGEVIVTFYLNGIRHIVRRSSKTHEILLKIAFGEFTQTTEEEIRNLLPIQAYSQKQLSSVGVRIEELKRFVELPIKHNLDQIRSEIRDAEAKIRVAYGNLIRKKEIEAEITQYNVEIESLGLQVAALRENLKGLSDEDQKIIKQKALYDNEELIVDGLENELVRMLEHVEALKRAFDEQTVDHQKDANFDPHQQSVELHNEKLVAAIRTRYAEKFTAIRSEIKALEALFDPESLKPIAEEVAKWQELKTAHDQKYEAAKTRASANQQQLTQIQAIERRVGELKRLQMTKRNSLAALGEPEATYAAQRTRWDNLHNQKLQQLREQCSGFSGLSSDLIQADVNGGLDTEALKQKLKAAFAGLNIKEQKIEDICHWVADASDIVLAWNSVLGEFEKLALHKFQGRDAQAVLPPTPIIDRCKIIETEKARIIGGFDAAKWLNLSLAQLEVNPVFKYCTNKDTNEYIDFADASAGQQATALLTVLLNQKGAPLIIDQPEDDVDSKMSPDIVRQIWKAKSSRQLIFSSHNANFVVNGDAELVICCDYVRAGDQTGGQIKFTGAIDNKSIKDEITIVTEGGKAAFKLRKEKYGF